MNAHHGIHSCVVERWYWYCWESGIRWTMGNPGVVRKVKVLLVLFVGKHDASQNDWIGRRGLEVGPIVGPLRRGHP